MDPIRRTILATGAAATAMAAAPGVFAQQTGQGRAAVPFYEKGAVRIHFEEAGSGFPLLLIAGAGLNSTIVNFTRTAPPESTVASRRTCATPIAASLVARSEHAPPWTGLVETRHGTRRGRDQAAT